MAENGRNCWKWLEMAEKKKKKNNNDDAGKSNGMAL